MGGSPSIKDPARDGGTPGRLRLKSGQDARKNVLRWRGSRPCGSRPPCLLIPKSAAPGVPASAPGSCLDGQPFRARILLMGSHEDEPALRHAGGKTKRLPTRTLGLYCSAGKMMLLDNADNRFISLRIFFIECA